MSERERLAACAGKVAFASAALAHALQQRRRRNGRKGTFRDNEPYRCQHCGKWHIGGNAKRRRS